jgi:hypothetical protein
MRIESGSSNTTNVSEPAITPRSPTNVNVDNDFTSAIVVTQETVEPEVTI